MDIFKNIVITDIFTPVVVHSEKGRKFTMKNRPYFGISCCIDGQITYTMNGKKYISNKSNIIFLPQGSSYSLVGNKEGLFPVINFCCKNLTCNEILIFPLDNPQRYIKDFEIIENLFLYNDNHLKIYSFFYELLDKIISNKRQENNILSSIPQIVEENISNPCLSNTFLARKIGISEVYLRKLFSIQYKTSPKQYILDIRIHKAKRMLINSPFTISAISRDCGFSSIYHFCRIFKQRTGLTPTEYSKKNSVYKI